MRAVGLRNCDLETFGAYREAMEATSGIRFTELHPYRGDPFPDPAEIDVLLVGGTPDAAYEADQHPYLNAEIDFLREVVARQIPTLGICCGAQLLALVLGGEVESASDREIGSYDVQLTAAGRASDILRGMPSVLPVFHWHADTFSVPPGAELLITGSPCRNQMYQSGVNFGVQFHLETSAAEAQAWATAYEEELTAARGPGIDIGAEASLYEIDRLRFAAVLVANLLRLAASPN
ncbi:MAG: amidotransferase [Acidobacteria bacterium]|nr:amidotransferase [Acidobacteriota bacterium]